MTEEGLSKAELKRQIDQLSKDLYNIDLLLQGLRHGKLNHFSKEQLKNAWDQVKHKLVEKEIEFKKLNIKQ